jgi:antibiotic biosynthesis monooxygenase (ABM) superfamily enzyme
VLSLLSRRLIPDAPWQVSLLLSNIIATALLTWVFMPPLTRWFDRWLHR